MSAQLAANVDSNAAPREQEVFAERVRHLYAQSPLLFVGLLFLYTIVPVFFWSRASHSLLIGWILANLALTVWRVRLVRSYKEQQPPSEDARRWANKFAFGSGLSGLLWGLTPVLFLQLHDGLAVLFLVIVLAGMIAGSLASLCPYLPAYAAYTFFSMAPLIAILLTSGEFVFIGALLTVSAVVHIGYAKNLQSVLVDSIAQRFVNADLVESFREQRDLAEKANEDKSRFLAATSHDLRQPLHALELLQHALQSELNTPRQRELMAKTKHASKSVSELLNAILSISRLDAGQVEILMQPLELGRLIEEILDEFVADAEASGATLQADLQPELWVSSDPVSLSRIVRNLLSNAVRHAPGSQIRVMARTADDHVVLTVADSGPGIPDEFHQAVFSEFYQLNNPERDRRKGLGLGLAIVQRLAPAIGGELSMCSSAQNGTEFTIRLPRATPTEQGELSVGRDDPDLSGELIVVVDDERDNLDAMRALLRSWDCEVVLAESVDSALEQLSHEAMPSPLLLMVDYRLREGTRGDEAVRKIRQHCGAVIPAIITTGDTTIKIQESLELPSTLVRYKPLDPVRLAADVEMLRNHERCN